jgi:hypothetical protein
MPQVLIILKAIYHCMVFWIRPIRVPLLGNELHSLWEINKWSGGFSLSTGKDCSHSTGTVLRQNKSDLCACEQLSFTCKKGWNGKVFFLKEKDEWRKAKAEWSYELKSFCADIILSILISRRKMNTIILAKRTAAWKIRMQISTRKLTMISCCRIIVFFFHTVVVR